jgi:aminopeptidase
MADPRVRDYARLIVEQCLDVQPGWQVLVLTSPLGRPLVEEVARAIARRGAYVLLRVRFANLGSTIGWIQEAPEDVLKRPAPIEVHAMETADALVAIDAPENTREIAAVPPERLALLQGAYRPSMERILSHEMAWVGCQFPTPALAQDAGMSLGEFEEFLYGACLLDWQAEGERMRRYAERFDAADEVRIVGDGTDLRLSLAGRTSRVDAGGANIPGGEFFFSPVEDAAEGTITFGEFPAVYAGREVTAIRFRFEGGRIVDASAAQNEGFLLETLDSDEGARRLGELGVGCNPGITRYMKNTLFDEKIDGTVHLAIGNGFPDLGGTNVSRIHWDIVKDLRRNGEIHLDGQLVQRDGRWLI